MSAFTMEGLTARMDAEGVMHIKGAPIRIDDCTFDATDWDGSVRICLHDGGEGCPGDSTEPMTTGQLSWFRFWCTNSPGWFEGVLAG